MAAPNILQSSPCSLVLAAHLTLPLQLRLSLLVAMRDQLIEEAPRLALVVSVTLSLLDLALQVASCLVVDIVFVFDVVEVGWGMSA